MPLLQNDKNTDFIGFNIRLKKSFRPLEKEWKQFEILKK